jgi:erythromycin esterase-like protein
VGAQCSHCQSRRLAGQHGRPPPQAAQDRVRQRRLRVLAGIVQAIEHNEHSSLNEITLGDPPEFHASVAFARTGKPLLVLDLRTLPTRGTVHDWFIAPHPVRDIGAVFSTERNMTASQILPERYDAVIFVDRTTRARPLPRSK